MYDPPRRKTDSSKNWVKGTLLSRVYLRRDHVALQSEPHILTLGAIIGALGGGGKGAAIGAGAGGAAGTGVVLATRGKAGCCRMNRS